jgi:hypothetical protein
LIRGLTRPTRGQNPTLGAHPGTSNQRGKQSVAYATAGVSNAPLAVSRDVWRGSPSGRTSARRSRRHG